jgi:hypothetical protein
MRSVDSSTGTPCPLGKLGSAVGPCAAIDAADWRAKYDGAWLILRGALRKYRERFHRDVAALIGLVRRAATRLDAT